jgi:broad specificity phosphatase PhoE
MHFGTWQGLTESQVQERNAPLLRKWKEKPAGFRAPGGESTKKAWKRINSQLREIIFTHGTGTIVVVTHRVPLKMMTAYLLGEKRGCIRDIRHDPCAISTFLIHAKGEYEPVSLNSSSHLKSLDLPEPDDF